MAQELYELPVGWEWKVFNDVCINITDGAHASPKTIDEGFPYVTVRDVDHKGQIDTVNCKRISEEDFLALKKANCQPPTNSLLLSKDGTVGKVAHVTSEYEEFVVLSSLAIITPNQKVLEPEYLKYFLLSPEFQDHAIGSKTGAAIKRIVLRTIKGFKIPLVQIEVQKCLVKKLDALLSRIDTAVEHLKRSLELNDQLFASSLNRAFNPLDAEIQADGTYQLPEGWEWKTLNDIFEIARGGSPRPIKSFITDNEDGINWIKIGDVATGEKYISQTAEKIKPEGVSKSRKVYPGDFILSNSMSFGRPYIMQIEGCIHDGWLLLRPLDKAVSVDFMYQLLSSPFMYRQFSFAASGTTVKNLNSDIARNSKVPIPSLKEQAAITEKLDEVQVKTQANKQVFQQKLEQLQQLKASLLDSAFRGEL